MSTTPSTSSSSGTYTLLGNAPFRGGKLPISLSVVVLNRDSRLLRPQVLEELDHLGAGEVISVEEPDSRVDFEGILKTTKSVRMLMVQKPCSPGEGINYAMEEARGEFVLVLWSDQVMPEHSINSKVLKSAEDSGILCCVPELKNRKGEEIPSLLAPTVRKKIFEVLSLSTELEVKESLFPFDYTGLYNRQKFLLTGGFDKDILSPFWQKADFGMRAHLWGERITLLRGLRLSYRGDVPAEDRSPSQGYKEFFLKNLAVKFQTDMGFLALRTFLKFWSRSGLGFYRSWSFFKKYRTWVQTHRYRFKSDARTMTELWGGFS